jgi:hypothetical protein
MGELSHGGVEGDKGAGVSGLKPHSIFGAAGRWTEACLQQADPVPPTEVGGCHQRRKEPVV